VKPAFRKRATISGSISIVSNAAQSTSSIALSGTGIASTQTLSLSTASVNFGNVNDGSSSSTQSVTVTNMGNANVSISAISLSGGAFSLSAAGTPVTLSPSQTVTFGVQFNPTAAGTKVGSVTVVSNATNPQGTISLTGNGVAPVTSHSVALSWGASTSTVVGYNVYRSTSSGSGYVQAAGSLLSGLTYTDSSVQSGSTYYYVTTAVDSNGDESDYSNEAQAIIP